MRGNVPDGTEQQGTAIDLTAYLDVLVRYRKAFLSVASVVICVGLIYAFLAKPVYRTELLVQIEESSDNSTARADNRNSPMVDVKPATTAEIELLRSRMVVGKAVDNLQLYIVAAPRYFPLIGGAIAGLNPGLSTPGLFGWGGFAWGHEAISVAQLEVPTSMEDQKLFLTALGDKQYRVALRGESTETTGTVGDLLKFSTAAGPVSLLVSRLEGRPGSQFVLRRLPRVTAISTLQERLIITERGKQSGVVGISLDGTSPETTAAILNEIGNAYVEQNLRRKAAEAEKSLAFLEQQLPQVKQQVEAAESRYNAMRYQRGTIDLSEESKLILSQSVQIQTRLQELKQKRQELASRFTPNHPALELVDNQIAGVTAQLNGITGKIQKLPDVEQNVLRLMRDVKVSTDSLQSLLNDVQQLKLIKASKVGTARIIDPAEVPVKPVRPNRLLISAVSLAVGLFAGLLVALVRNMLDGGIADADDIERQTGMTVYSTIPFSGQQEALQSNGELLAMQSPGDPAIETLRGFRTALQFALSGSNNRTVVITGPAPGVGKSFISSNFAAIAAAGHRIVLIDADLRRGELHHAFDIKGGPGLTELLMGAPLDQVVRRQVTPGLDFIPTGTKPPNAADILLSPAMDTLLDQLKSRYDLVLIDTPPVLAASDAGILAAKASAVFLVARAESTTINELIASQKSIQQAGARIKGVLLNGLVVEGRWYRAHYYFGKYRYPGDYSNAQSKRA
jgi:tyrosine-protein kinase Etk/Wzc